MIPKSNFGVAEVAGAVVDVVGFAAGAVGAEVAKGVEAAGLEKNDVPGVEPRVAGVKAGMT